MTTSAQKERLSITPSPRSPEIRVSTPGSRLGGRSPVNDEAMWSRLQEAGFDEESIKRRDKAALIAYIAKLESEVFDYQHQMGLLLMEKKDWSSKYDEVKASRDSIEVKCKCDQAAHLSALAEAKKREESLRKSLAIEKECLTNIEKALHEMRAESAATKLTAESKLAEANSMLENAQKKFAEAEQKTRTAEAAQDEASRYLRIAERKLQEVEEREDDLRRRTISFKSECDKKEKEISIERQSLTERQKIIQQEQERLLDGQALLNQREEYISGKLSRLEKELEDSKAKMESELKDLNEEYAELNKKLADLKIREEAVSKREVMLNKKEAELLCVQEKIANKEHDEIQRLVAKHQASLEIKKLELEQEMEQKHKLMQDEMDIKRRVFELKEIDLGQREEYIHEREQQLLVQLRVLHEKEKETAEKLSLIQEKEESICASEQAREVEKMYIQKEKEQLECLKVDVQKSVEFLENKKKEVEEAQEQLEASSHERKELRDLEMRLKDELDSIRFQKLDLETEAENLKAEKSKFEAEWELIDEKREKLQKEAEQISEEKKAVSKFLKDEHDRLKAEKDALREQFKCDLESLSREREEFVSKMEQEHSEWFSKIQLERENFVQDIELQKIELENLIRKRRDEIESYLKEKEESFEQEKAKELHHISSLKEMLAKDRENVESEMKRLEKEKTEIAMDRERRQKELAQLEVSIEELKIQREKLKEQRELLHSDRDKINADINHLSQLESLKLASENFVLPEIGADYNHSSRNLPNKRYLALQTNLSCSKQVLTPNNAPVRLVNTDLHPKHAQGSRSPPTSTPISFLKRCTEILFKYTPEKSSISPKERQPATGIEGAKLMEDKYLHKDGKVVFPHQENLHGEHIMTESQPTQEEERRKYIFGKVQPVKSVNDEPKVILEVPFVGDNAEKVCNLESGTKTEVTENVIPIQGIMVGKKRGNSSQEKPDTSLKQKGEKKRKQNIYSDENPIEESTSNCAGDFSVEENVSGSPRGNGVSFGNYEKSLGDHSEGGNASYQRTGNGVAILNSNAH